MPRSARVAPGGFVDQVLNRSVGMRPSAGEHRQRMSLKSHIASRTGPVTHPPVFSRIARPSKKETPARCSRTCPPQPTIPEKRRRSARVYSATHLWKLACYMVSPLARSRSVSRGNRATSPAFLRLLMGPSRAYSSRRLSFRLDQFLGSRLGPQSRLGFVGNRRGCPVEVASV